MRACVRVCAHARTLRRRRPASDDTMPMMADAETCRLQTLGETGAWFGWCGGGRRTGSPSDWNGWMGPAARLKIERAQAQLHENVLEYINFRAMSACLNVRARARDWMIERAFGWVCALQCALLHVGYDVRPPCVCARVSLRIEKVRTHTRAFARALSHALQAIHCGWVVGESGYAYVLSAR